MSKTSIVLSLPHRPRLWETKLYGRQIFFEICVITDASNLMMRRKREIQTFAPLSSSLGDTLPLPLSSDPPASLPRLSPALPLHPSLCRYQPSLPRWNRKRKKKTLITFSLQPIPSSDSCAVLYRPQHLSQTKMPLNDNTHSTHLTCITKKY